MMLSNAGPLGPLKLLYTPTAMIIAQAVLVTPIIVALTCQLIGDLNAEYRDQMRAMRLSFTETVSTLLWDARLTLPVVVSGRSGPRHRRGGCGDDRWRQHRPCDARDDHHDRA
jgi:ABC-type tungstate transport system substrate-binding protein